MTHDQPTERPSDDAQTTYYRAAGGTHGSKILHTERDCPALKNAPNVREATRAQCPAHDLCRWCTGDGGRARDQSTLAHTLEKADSLEAAVEAMDEQRRESGA